MASAAVLSKGSGSVVVDLLFIVTPIVRESICSMFYCTVLYVHSSFAIILMWKRELIALLGFSRGTKVEKMLTLAPERYTAGFCMVAKVILWCI